MVATVVDIVEVEGLCRVVVHGALDLACLPRARTVLASHPSVNAPDVLVDLHACDFVDSVGLGLLLGVLRRARSLGGRVTLVGIPASLGRTLDLTGLGSLFELASATGGPNPW